MKKFGERCRRRRMAVRAGRGKARGRSVAERGLWKNVNAECAERDPALRDRRSGRSRGGPPREGGVGRRLSFCFRWFCLVPILCAFFVLFYSSLFSRHFEFALFHQFEDRIPLISCNFFLATKASMEVGYLCTRSFRVRRAVTLSPNLRKAHPCFSKAAATLFPFGYFSITFSGFLHG